MQRDFQKPKTSPSDSWFAFPRTLLPLPGGLGSRHFAVLLTLAGTVSKGDGKFVKAGHTSMTEQRLAELVGSWAGRRTGEVPRPMNITLLRRSLQEIEEAGVGRRLKGPIKNVVFKWEPRYRCGLEARGGSTTVVEQGQEEEVSRAWVKVPKALAYDAHLTGTEKLVYVALCWGVFQLPASRAKLWSHGTFVSQKSILPEWTGMSERTVNSTVEQLEKVRLILRHPDQLRGRIPRISFVPIPVRYVRLLGGPVQTTRKQQSLYWNLAVDEREDRYAYWLASEQADLPESLWNAVWNDSDKMFGYELARNALDELMAEEQRVAERVAQADREAAERLSTEHSQKQARQEEWRAGMPATPAQPGRSYEAQHYADEVRRHYRVPPKPSGDTWDRAMPGQRGREQLVGVTGPPREDDYRNDQYYRHDQ